MSTFRRISSSTFPPSGFVCFCFPVLSSCCFLDLVCILDSSFSAFSFSSVIKRYLVGSGMACFEFCKSCRTPSSNPSQSLPSSDSSQLLWPSSGTVSKPDVSPVMASSSVEVIATKASCKFSVCISAVRWCSSSRHSNLLLLLFTLCLSFPPEVPVDFTPAGVFILSSLFPFLSTALKLV
ncbi:hypothetical protein AQUCO_08500022v1 [Aquilegia coerulea]|uniref:Uncharacterized protein n=1 Tax=Aquilegia coerulea TaxID=218851 RepID=A0A2G5C6N1_AQUCA|nr:hypothetical protein AQUCO_08500022v1 [Aquilegia coerulea]